MKELYSFHPGFVLMHKVPEIKMLLKQQNERKDEKLAGKKTGYPGLDEK